MRRRTAAVSIATFVALLLVYAEPTGARASGVAQPQAFATCGQPAFGPGVRTTVDLPTTTDVVVADFNDDGLPDLAVFGFERARRV